MRYIESMVMKKLLLIVLLGCLVTTQNWISEVKPQPIENNLQKQDQKPLETPQLVQRNVDYSVKKDETQISQSAQKPENMHSEQEKKEKQPQRANREEIQEPRNPFDRSSAQKPMHPNAKKYESMSEQQLMRQMQNMKGLPRRQGRQSFHKSRGPRKDFKRRAQNQMDLDKNMPMLCMIGFTVVGSALLCCCVKKCKKHSKKSMEKMLRRREMTRFQRMQPSVQQMPINPQNMPAPTTLTIDQKIHYHEIELQRLKFAYQQRNQGYYEGQSIPVGQPVSQGNLMRTNEYRY